MSFRLICNFFSKRLLKVIPVVIVLGTSSTIYMKHITYLSACLLVVLNASPVSAAPAFIPKPSSVQLNQTTTDLAAFRKINANDDLAFERQYLAGQLELLRKAAPQKEAGGSQKEISLKIAEGEPQFDYELQVGADAISLTGRNAAGVFQGIQTLLQFPTLKKGQADLTIPTGVVRDKAKFQWRGVMLDSSRHFQPVDEIKAFIDHLAYYKFNVFHWHLTDDQGWRIEIKKHPKLTEVGAWRVPREGIWWYRPGPKEGEKPTYGGFYTQEQIKEIVAYAKERHIHIVPEIDVPGHAMAILAAYPELSTTGGPFQVNPGSQFWNKIENTLDPSNPKTYQLLEDIFSEVASLFPAPYVHIGGDEATKKFWEADPDCKKFMKENGLKNGHELQSYFIKRVEKILAKNKKKLLGWDEILEGGLADTATVMSWRGVGGANKASQMGRDVIIAANSAYYFDLYQGHPEYEPTTYGRLRLKRSYLFDYQLPKGVDSKHLLGFHGCLWSEEVPNKRHAEYMLWPRALALTEAAWSTDRKKDWPEFVQRVESHFDRLDFLGINYARSIYDPTVKLETKNKRFVLTLGTEIDGLDIHYTFDDTDVDEYYPVYKGPLTVPYGATSVRVRTYRDGKPVGRACNIVIGNINKKKKVLFPTTPE